MITPLDIQNKEFKRSFRGYDIKDVDIFLDDIIEDYEKIYKENIDLKDKINALSEQIRQFNTMEETLKNTLILAQNTSDEVVSSAKIKAQNIIKDSEINGNMLIDHAMEDVRKINNEFDYLKREMFSFKIKYESFINAQLISLENFFKEIEENKTKDKPDELIMNFQDEEESNLELNDAFDKVNLAEELEKDEDSIDILKDAEDSSTNNNNDDEHEFIEE